MPLSSSSLAFTAPYPCSVCNADVRNSNALAIPSQNVTPPVSIPRSDELALNTLPWDMTRANMELAERVSTLQNEIKYEQTRSEKTKKFVAKHYGWLLTAVGSMLLAGTWLLNLARLHSAKPPKVKAVVSTLSDAVIHGTPASKLPTTMGDKIGAGLTGVGVALGAEQLAHVVGSNQQNELLEKAPGLLGKLWGFITEHGDKVHQVTQHLH